MWAITVQEYEVVPEFRSFSLERAITVKYVCIDLSRFEFDVVLSSQKENKERKKVFLITGTWFTCRAASLWYYSCYASQNA